MLSMAGELKDAGLVVGLVIYLILIIGIIWCMDLIPLTATAMKYKGDTIEEFVEIG